MASKLLCYLQRKISIFLRNNHDCQVVDPYNRHPQDWPYRGIQRISWPANRSRFVTKWLKRGRVHNLALQKKNSWMKILLKKAQTHKNSNFGKHTMLRFYEKHNLASKLFLFNKETHVEICESVCGKSKCDCRCLHFWHDCCFLESSVLLISCVCIFDTIAAISRLNQKTDTTAQVYCTLYMYVTQKKLFPTKTKILTQCHKYCTLDT